jgi:hypothetical protein
MKMDFVSLRRATLSIDDIAVASVPLFLSVAGLGMSDPE